LDYRHPETRRAVTGLLLEISELCDGLRCDMAMLVTTDVFCRTWGGRYEPQDADFWPEAIRALKRSKPGFLMLAEVYWNLEYDLQQQGFDYVYDKRLYDRLRGHDYEAVRQHLFADLAYQRRLARFVENHDEKRAAAEFGPERSLAAAAVALTLPGLRLIHEGQLDGRNTRIPVQLVRRPPEPPHPDIVRFYESLLTALRAPVFHDGVWRLLQALHSGVGTHGNFVVHRWVRGEEFVIVAVNLSPHRSHGRVPLELPGLTGATWELRDAISGQIYEREGDAMLHPGLFIELPAYGVHIFESRLKARKLPTGLRHQTTVRPPAGKTVIAMGWSPDARSMALSGDKPSISLIDIETGDCYRELEGHRSPVGALAWSPTDRLLASGSEDRTVRIWSIDTGHATRVLEGQRNNILTVAWSPDGRMVAAGGIDRRVSLWDVKGGRPQQRFGKQSDTINAIAWSPDGRRMAVGSGDQTVHVWDVRIPELLFELRGRDWIAGVAWSKGDLIASGTGGGIIDVWEANTSRHVAICEGHTQRLLGVSFSCDGRILASKSADGTLRLWRTDNFQELAVIQESGIFLGGLAFHPTQSLLATRDDSEKAVRIWAIDTQAVHAAGAPQVSVQYASAKVVVVGESGTGKTCLVNALLGKPFAAQPSTHAMEVALFLSDTAPGPAGSEIVREILLWDLAGQTDYQLVHQLFLEQTALAVVLFDGTHPDNPFGGVGHWEKALRKIAGESVPRILVAGRADRGRPAVDDATTAEFMSKHGFADYVATSAVTGRGVQELRDLIAKNLDWDRLPFTSSPELWNQVRTFLVESRAEGVYMTTRARLRKSFEQKVQNAVLSDDAFSTVIAHAEVQGLVSRLSFGDYVLLKPELLNWYASAIVRVARDNGLGSVRERDVLEAHIDFEDMERLQDPELERALLHGVVELFLRREIALREGEQIVFPSKFNRPRPELPRIPPFEVAYTFSGAIEDVYATLVVRVFYGGAFKLNELWRNAAEFRDAVGRTCGFQLDALEEGRGVMSIFFGPGISLESKLLFLKFVAEHLSQRALPGSVGRRRFYRCGTCTKEVKDREVIEWHLQQGSQAIRCQYCGASIPLQDVLEERFGDPAVLSSVEQLQGAADRQIGHAVAGVIREAKTSLGEYDVFLAYDGEDLAAVTEVAEALRDRGVRVWFDKWEVLPGRSFIDEIEKAFPRTSAAAVFFGKAQFSRWKRREMQIALHSFVNSGTPLIPVLLPPATAGAVPLTMRDLNRVRFETVPDAGALESLVAGITGRTGGLPRRGELG
jgi:small GTP-binding protein